MVTIVIGIAAGIYTSNYLSKLKVSDVLKNTTFLGKKRTYIRFCTHNYSINHLLFICVKYTNNSLTISICS